MYSNLARIRDQIACHLGETVRIRTVKGRRKQEEKHGVIQAVYPKVFTVYITEYQRPVSFTYAELLTREIQLEFISSQANIVL